MTGLGDIMIGFFIGMGVMYLIILIFCIAQGWDWNNDEENFRR